MTCQTPSPLGILSSRTRYAVLLGWVVVAMQPVLAAGDPAAVRRWGVEDGLSHNAVHAIAQDAWGFVWFGTQDGLDRFDGLNITHFDREVGASHTLASPFVTALAAASDGSIWVGTRRGLHRVDRTHARIDSIELPVVGEQPIVRALLVAEHTLWVATAAGLYSLTVSASELYPAVIAAGDAADVIAISRGNHGEIWAVTRDQECAVLAIGSDGRIGTTSRSFPCTTALWVDEQDQLWIDLEAPLDSAADIEPARLERLPWGLAGSAGGLLARDTAGVHRRRWNDERVEALWRGRTPDSEMELSSEVLSLYIDHDQGLWLGTYDGVFRLDPDATAFESLPTASLPGLDLAQTPISAIAGSDDGDWLWLGTFGLGLLAFDRLTDSWRHWRHDPEDSDSLCSDYIWSVITLGADRVLIDGYCEMNTDGRVLRRSRLPPRSYRNIMLDDDQTVWLTSELGLFRRVGTGWERVLEGAFEAVVAAVDGGLWLAAVPDEDALATSAVRHFDPQGGQVRHFELPVHEYLFDMLPVDDLLWIATGTGLFRLEPASGRWQHFLPATEDAGRVFYSLSVDNRQRLWIGSNRGLLRFDPDRPPEQRFLLYDRLDGVGNLEFNRRVRYQDGTGRLYLGGMNGVTVFDPAAVDDPLPIPRPMITAIHVLGVGGDRHTSALGLEQLLLGPGDAAVTFEFTGLGFRRADRFRFRYRLHSFDTDWIESGRVRQARYTNLAPGTYRFEAMVANREGVWSDHAATVNVVVAPPWHARLTVRAGAALAFFALLVWAYRARIRHLLTMERMRLGIAADLHDELGSELAAIRVNALILEDDPALDASQRSRLQTIGVSADTVVQALRDIVWYVNPEHDRLDALLGRMRAHAHAVLGAHHLQFTAVGTDHDLPLPMITRRQLYLIFKEAMNNLIRHAQASRVEIRLELDGEQLLIEIVDDGTGFDQVSGDGTGLASMRRRAEAIGARLGIASEPGGGTRVRVTLPMTQMRSGRRWSRRFKLSR